MTKQHQYEVVIVGSGGAGLMAGLFASKTATTAVLSKLHPTRSHTGTAQGGVGAALGNQEEDHPEWHTYDSVKGSDYLGDQDAIEFMCNEAVQAVYDLEHMGLPFSRTPDGRIAQRPFGGHTNNVTGKPVRRSCYAADRTGHMILQTLYQQCLRNQVTFYDEYQVLDLILVNGSAAGVVAMELVTGELHIFWVDGRYIGPSAIVNAHRFIFDSRDCGAIPRLNILNERMGVWRCRTIFNCTEACPRDIKITKAIAEIKRVLSTGILD